MESIVTSIISSVIVGGIASYVLLKVLEERITNLVEKYSKMEKVNDLQERRLTELETSHRLQSKYMEDFRVEQKKENEIMRIVLQDNTKAIAKLDALLERIETRL